MWVIDLSQMPPKTRNHKPLVDMTHDLNRLPGSQAPLDISRVVDAEQSYSGRRPLGERMRNALSSRSNEVNWFWCDPPDRAYAVAAPRRGGIDLELVADPANLTAGTELLDAICDRMPTGRLWTHGDKSCGRDAAEAIGLEQERELWLMSKDLTNPITVPQLPEGFRLRLFRPGSDDISWLELNRQAFEALPDQGSWTAADLQTRLAADWYDPNGFLVAEHDGRLIGFHWTKLENLVLASSDETGEVFLIAVAEEYRGTSVAAALLMAGLQHLQRQGARNAHLFVDVENSRAAKFYANAGFKHRDSDRCFSWKR